MFCKNCGNQIADGEKFCRNCGTPVGKAAVSAEPQQNEGSEPLKAVPLDKEKVSLDKKTENEKVSLDKSSKEEKVILEKNPESEAVSLEKNSQTPKDMDKNTAVPSTPKFCKGCGKPLAEGVKFCKNCGKPVSNNAAQTANAPISAPLPTVTPKFCKGCGKPLAEGVKFCKNCGKPVTGNNAVSADEPTAVIPPINAQPPVNQSTVPTAQPYGTPVPYNATVQQPKPPRKPLPKKALIGIIAGGVALIAIIVVIIVLVNMANDPVTKMMGYIDSGSSTEAKQLYASSFRYNEENLARLEAEVIKKVDEIEKQYADGTLTEEQALDKLNVICALSSYDIYQHGYDGKDYIEKLKDSEEYFEKATGYKNEGDYLRAIRYYGYVENDTPKYQDAQTAITECLNAYVQSALDSAAEYVKNKDYSSAIYVLESAAYDLDSDTYADYIAQLNSKIEAYKEEKQKAFKDAMKAKVESEGYIAAIKDIYDVAYEMGISLDSDTHDTMVEEYKNAYINDALNEAQKVADSGDYSAAATVLMRANEAYDDAFWDDLDSLTSKANDYAEKVLSLNDLEDLATKTSGWDTPYRNDSGIANSAFTGTDGQEQYMYTGFSATYSNADVAINLNKEYVNFKGIASFEKDNEADDVTITFVGDGKNLKSITLSKDHPTENFDIDLTGITVLNISVKKTSTDKYADAYIALVDNVVTKAESKPEQSSTETSEETSQNNEEPSQNSEETSQVSDESSAG